MCRSRPTRRKLPGHGYPHTSAAPTRTAPTEQPGDRAPLAAHRLPNPAGRRRFGTLWAELGPPAAEFGPPRAVSSGGAGDSAPSGPNSAHRLPNSAHRVPSPAGRRRLGTLWAELGPPAAEFGPPRAVSSGAQAIRHPLGRTRPTGCRIRPTACRVQRGAGDSAPSSGPERQGGERPFQLAPVVRDGARVEGEDAAVLVLVPAPARL